MPRNSTDNFYYTWDNITENIITPDKDDIDKYYTTLKWEKDFADMLVRKKKKSTLDKVEKPAPRPVKILFLDIDGVLNNDTSYLNGWTKQNDGTILPKELRHFTGFDYVETRDIVCMDSLAISHLNAVVSNTSCKIVISSTWRKTYSMDRLKAVLERAGFLHGHRIIGATPWLGKQRGIEVDAWLEEYTKNTGPVLSYAIVDDSPDFSEEHKKKHLVLVDAKRGLADVNYARNLIKILNG